MSLAVGLGLGCPTARPPSATPGAATPPPDSLIARVAVVGAEPATIVQLESMNKTVVAAGDQVALLRSVDRALVRLEGRAAGSGVFDVLRFEVREIGGEAVTDGVVLQVPGGLALRTAAGKTVMLLPPLGGALAQALGKRVWVAIASNGSVRSSGEIRAVINRK